MIGVRTTLLTVLTLASLLSVPRIALADFMANSGSGGYYDKITSRSYRYEYEVWANDDNTEYTLKVWKSQNYPNGSTYRSANFESARQALDYFDCYYAGKQDVCRQMR